MLKLASFIPTTIQLVKRSEPWILRQFVRSRNPSHCRGPRSPHCKPQRVLDIRNVNIERAIPDDAEEIRRFLHCHFWPMEPSVMGLWVPLDSPYLEFLTYKYCTSVYRLLAVERDPVASTRKLLGVCISTVVCPWQAEELDNWAGCTLCKPSRDRMHFCAHLLRSPNLFAKYNVPVILEVEVLSVDQEVNGNGIGTMLMREAIATATDLRYPLIQVMCTSTYTAKICQRLGLTREWSIKYEDFLDEKGGRVFYPREPHLDTTIYIKTLDKC